jgi:transcriptional regulator with XRE-family HTH domain
MKPTRHDDEQVPAGFRQLVKDRMHQQRLTLRDLAEATDISPAYLCRILQDERGLPPENDTILRMAKALGIHPPELLLVEANRVEPWMKEGVMILLSATTAKTTAEKEQAIKKVQAFLLSRKAKGSRK